MVIDDVDDPATAACCRGDVVQHRPGEQEGDGDGPRVPGRRPREHLQGQEGRAPRLMNNPPPATCMHASAEEDRRERRGRRLWWLGMEK